MKIGDPGFFGFVSRFVDAVTTQPLELELRRATQRRQAQHAAFEFDRARLRVIDGDGPTPDSGAFEFDDVVTSQAA